MIRVPIHEGYSVAHAIFRPRATGWNGVNNDMNEHGFRGQGAGAGFFIGYMGIRRVYRVIGVSLAADSFRRTSGLGLTAPSSQGKRGGVCKALGDLLAIKASADLLCSQLGESFRSVVESSEYACVLACVCS